MFYGKHPEKKVQEPSRQEVKQTPVIMAMIKGESGPFNPECGPSPLSAGCRCPSLPAAPAASPGSPWETCASRLSLAGSN